MLEEILKDWIKVPLNASVPKGVPVLIFDDKTIVIRRKGFNVASVNVFDNYYTKEEIPAPDLIPTEEGATVLVRKTLNGPVSIGEVKNGKLANPLSGGLIDTSQIHSWADLPTELEWNNYYG